MLPADFEQKTGNPLPHPNLGVFQYIKFPFRSFQDRTILAQQQEDHEVLE
jgi:hypothetical protein